MPRPTRIISLLAAVCLSTAAAPALAHSKKPTAETPQLFVPDLDSHHGEATPWTSLDVKDDPSRFHFAIVTDRTGGHRAGVFARAPHALNRLQPAFVMSVGDFIEGYTRDADKVRAEWDGIAETVSPLEAPLFFTPGNHDLSNDVQYQVWKERFGADYYHFLYKDTLFLVLNTEVFPEVVATLGSFLGTVSDPETVFAAQIAYVKAVLAAHPDVRWTFVMVHQPVWQTPGYGAAPGWQALRAALGDRPHTLFAGHEHVYEHVTDPEHGHDRITLATTGGGHQGLRGPAYGEFDHVTWVTMPDKGDPVIGTVLLDGILPKALPVAETRAAADRLAQSVTITPLMISAGPFEAGSQTVTLANDGDAPIEAKAVLRANATLSAAPSSVSAILAPGETRTMEITLTAARPMEPAKLVPVTATWSFASLDADGQVHKAQRPAAFLPETVYRLPRSADAITVDGDLSDWGGAGALRFSGASQRNHGDSHFGPEDFAGRFDLRASNEALYVAVCVTDDRVVTAPGEDLTNQDHVQLRLDLRQPEARLRNRSGTEEFASLATDPTAAYLTRYLALNAAPHGGGADPLAGDLLNSVWMPAWPGTAAAALRTETGYTIEIAIPKAGLGQGLLAKPDTDEAGAHLRFNLMVQDYDHPADRVEHLWRLARTDGFGHPRTGLFALEGDPASVE